MKPDKTEPSRGATTIEAIGGLRVTIVDLGATIRSIIVPAPDAAINVVLSYDDRRSYQADPYYLGSTVGPFANRINTAAFTLNSIPYQLDRNEADRGNCLHGGTNGLHRQQQDDGVGGDDRKSRRA